MPTNPDAESSTPQSRQIEPFVGPEETFLAVERLPFVW